ncbi:MAG: MFS transporter, partial [Aliidongia sp.]
TGLCLVIFEPIAGIVSDRFGRRPVALISGVALLLVTIPLFVMVTELRSVAALYGAVAVISVLLAFFASPILVALAEGLPKSIRSGALAIIYAVSIAIFGGSAQFVVKWLSDVTGNPLAPGWYMTLALAIGLVALALLRETAPAVTGKME